MLGVVLALCITAVIAIVISVEVWTENGNLPYNS